MSETFHEYDFPHDRSVHWHALASELREGATTARALGVVTCAGCRGWVEKNSAVLDPGDAPSEAAVKSGSRLVEMVVIPERGLIGDKVVRSGDLIFYTPSKMAFRIVPKWSPEWIWRKFLGAIR